ncbi:MAG: lipocalin family protein [Muribaculaceae bacterium]|nr:lipocalin family protein [Muribaculaceae bacterium]
MKVKKYLSALLMLVMLCALIPLTGCSKDEDGISSPALIIGKWQGVSSSGWEKEDGKVVDKWNDKESFDYDFIEFFYDASGEWWYADSNRKHSFAWCLNEGKDGIEVEIGEGFVGNGTGDTYKIKTLTKDKLVLVSGDDDPDDGWYQEDTYKRID